MGNRFQDLSRYRIDRALDDLETAEILLKNKKYNQSVNRSYYAILHAVRSLLALDGFDSHKHSGIISYFNRNYIKTGKIEIEYSKILTAIFKIRNDSDYKDFYTIIQQDVEIQLMNSKKFVKRIQDYLKSC